MKAFIEYLDTNMPDQKGNKILFQFKRDTLSAMNDRYEEVTGRGVKNDDVFTKLIISEHQDLDAEYAEYYKNATAAARRKRRTIGNIVGSISYILLLLICYIGISFMTQEWSHTWLIIVDGILLWVCYLLSLGVVAISKLKRVFHIFARVLLAMDVVVLSVAVFLYVLNMIGISVAWLIVIGGIIAMFVADLLYVSFRRQKLAVIYYLLYIPAIFAMLFIIVCSTGLMAWNAGWVLIPIGFVVDVLIILGELLESKHFEKEMMKAWQGN